MIPAPLSGVAAPMRLFAALLLLALAACAQTPGGGLSSSPSAPAASAVDPARLVRIAEAAAQARDYGLAVHLYREALRHEPAQSRLRVALADALLAGGAADQAFGEYRAVLAETPAPVAAQIGAMLGLARYHLAAGRPKEAQVWFEQVLTLAPANRSALNGVAVAHDLSGDHEAAQAAYVQALALHPGDLSLRANYALSLALSGGPARARAVLAGADTSQANAAQSETIALVHRLAEQDGAPPAGRQRQISQPSEVPLTLTAASGAVIHRLAEITPPAPRRAVTPAPAPPSSRSP